jgi:hypothetical protein
MPTEQYRTIVQASKDLGVPAYALRRAARNGIIPTYRAFSNRWVVKISEVEAVIRELQAGGAGQ